MSKSDVEMEDAEKHSHKVQGSETKAIDDSIEGEGEKLPCTAAVLDDANKTENSGKDINESRNEDKEKDNIEVEEQANPTSEGNEPIEGSIQEKSNTIDENAKLINTKTEDEEQPAPRSAVDRQMDTENEVFPQNMTGGEEKEETSAENCLNGGNHLKIVEEKSNEYVTEEEHEELVKGDADGVENAAGDNKTISEGDADDVDNAAGDNRTISEGNADDVENVAGDDKTISRGGDVENVAGVDKTISRGGDVENVAGDSKKISEGNADCVENVVGDNKTMKADDAGNDPSENRQLPTEVSTNQPPQTRDADAEMGEAQQGDSDGMKDSTDLDGDKTVKDDTNEIDVNAITVETSVKRDEDSSFANQQEPSTPNSVMRDSLEKGGDHSGGTVKSVFTPTALPLLGEDDDGTLEEQAAFMKEIESFYRQRTMDFKPPKFYGQPLNCLKLWRAVIRLGGYDRVTGSKLWRQVGESFHPPKTCTTVSWTFRIFYEKSLLEYERHKALSGELQLPVAAFPEASGVDVEGNGYQGSGRARRDAAARAMQGWHAQRLSDYGEVGEPIIKDKNLNNVAKREKNLKSIGSLKQKRPSEVEHSNKAARTEISKQLVTSVVDVGPPADWVKINVRQTKDCFEIYALVPGLLREEVRVQTDPAGRVVITGQPDQVDNPWGITPFRKVVSLPSRIDPLQTSAVVSLHGRLFIRVPFEQQPNA